MWPCLARDEQARAILKTVLSQVRTFAVWSQRAAVKSRHTWQRLTLHGKCPKSYESIGKHSCSLRLVLSVQQMRINSTVSRVPAMWKKQFGSSLFPSRLCERQCCPFSARDKILLVSARGIVVSLYLAFGMHARFLPFCLFLGWLMHASHMLSYRTSAQGP